MRSPPMDYDRITEPPRVSVQARLNWLRRDPHGYRPQPLRVVAALTGILKRD
jgi:hypothetical protein